MLPSITIVGNTTGPAELRYTGTGKAVATITVVANKRRKTDAGGWEDAGRSPFIRLSLWGADAEALAEQLDKPAAVIVTGQLMAREYETRDGDKRESLELEYPTVGIVVRPRRGDREKPAQQQQRQADPWATGAGDPWATPPASTEPPF